MLTIIIAVDAIKVFRFVKAIIVLYSTIPTILSKIILKYSNLPYKLIVTDIFLSILLYNHTLQK